MTKKNLGYVELEWVCPNCSTRNPGSKTICGNCGTAQPPDVEFQQAAEETFIEDEEKLAQAQAGPDIHCAYCGTRNKATNTECINCGAGLDEATQRQAGEVLGAHKTERDPDIKCPNCGTMNVATRVMCYNCGTSLHAEEKPKPAAPVAAPASGGGLVKWLLIAGGILLVVACFALIFLSTRSDAHTATVSDVNWERSIVILAPIPVSRQDWQDEIPRDADVGACRQELHHTSDYPEAGSREVCGTPYTVDTGGGFGEVSQDCFYEVMAPYCEYSTVELAPVDTAVLSGADMSPTWPQLQLLADQQEGEREESYTVVFDVDGEQRRYNTSSAERFSQLRPGTEWTVQINTFGSIVDVEPAE